jgi:hypothetical protein
MEHASFPHVGTQSKAQQFTFTPVLLGDIMSQTPEDVQITDKHTTRPMAGVSIAV